MTRSRVREDRAMSDDVDPTTQPIESDGSKEEYFCDDCGYLLTIANDHHLIELLRTGICQAVCEECACYAPEDEGEQVICGTCGCAHEYGYDGFVCKECGRVLVCTSYVPLPVILK